MSVQRIIHSLRRFKNWCLFRQARFGREVTPTGLAYFPYNGEPESEYLRTIDAPDALMVQLQELRRRGLCIFRNRKFEISWKDAYNIAYGSDEVLSDLLQLGTVEPVRIVVESVGEVGTSNFSILINNFDKLSGNCQTLLQQVDQILPMTTSGNLLSLENYHLLNEVSAFQSRSHMELTTPEAASAWRKIVLLAFAAKADVKKCVTQRISLNIENLRLVFRLINSTSHANVIELVPYFTGSPPAWRAVFLNESGFSKIYDVPGPSGRTQVEVEDCVAPILFEAKKLQGRPGQIGQSLVRSLQFIDELDLEDMSPEAFEHLCALIYRKLGYPKSFRVGGSGDGGVDVVCLNGTRGLLIQCKSSKELDKRLGWEGVKDVVAGEAAYRLQYPGVIFQKIALTNQFFNDTARSQAKINDVSLMDKNDILREIRKLHISYFELRHFCKGAV